MNMGIIEPKSPEMLEFTAEIEEYISPEQQYFELQKTGAKCYPLKADESSSVWKGIFRKHEIKYYFAKQIFPILLDATKGATERIKIQPQLANYSFFYAEVPFTASATDRYDIKTLFYELSLDFDKSNGNAQIISMFPPDRLIKAGTKTKKTVIKGNLAISVPEITGLPPIGGISFSFPIEGEKEWKDETITEITYDVMIPEVESGDNSNDQLHWKFLNNPQFPIGGRHTPALIFGIPKTVSKSNNFKFRSTLEIDGKKIPSYSASVVFQ